MTFLFQIAFMVLLISCASSQKNIANNGTAYQSSNYHWSYNNAGYLVASLAITGGPTHDFFTTSCATTATNPARYVVWWMLAFPVDTVYITSVRIYYRSDTPQRLAGYSLYVSNSSISKTDGYLCYHDEGPGLPSVYQDRNCNNLGQYVIIYNERNETSSYNPAGYSPKAVFELCEVEVYGCYKTWYGTNCESRCSLKCVDRHCFPGNGTCIWGCNCLRDSNCDVSTTCNEGCEKGYAGRFCNYYNLASNKVATQYPSIGHVYAELSIDGDKTTGSCSRTSGSQAWWQVDLGDMSTITAIYITYQYTAEMIQRSDGHSLYVSSTSGMWTDGISLNLTSTFINSFPFIHYLVDHVVLGRYITYVPLIVNGIAYVDICEVEVVGCAVGTYGKDCNDICPQNCYGSCHPDTGLCVLGCNDGWNNQYSNCNQTCESPRFGKNCENYSYCFNNEASAHVNGTCPSGGCQKGWEGTSCSAVCNVGRFGYNCNESCGGCLMDSCDRINGICTNTSGCRPGWKSEIDKCDVACESPRFGKNCENYSYCFNNEASAHVNGTCPSDGCQKGWEGTSCSAVCNVGRFGYNCNESCGGCLMDSCDRINGICTNTSGCRPGWKSEIDKCDVACDDGYFGDCASMCHCRTGKCQKTTGICPNDQCDEGWMGNTCFQECSTGYFGFNCDNYCDRCSNASCERFDGNCTYGCIEGFKGYRCHISVIQQEPSVSDPVPAIGGAIGAGIVVLVLIVIVVFFLRYRRGKTDGDTTRQNTTGYLNDAFTNDYANIEKEQSLPTIEHYEALVQQDNPNVYDCIETIKESEDKVYVNL